MIFANSFEAIAAVVLVAQSAWSGAPTWEHIATVQDYLKDGQGRHCLQIATAEDLSGAECVFGFDEFDAPHTKRELPWLNHVYKKVPENVTLVCNAACGAGPGISTRVIPEYPPRCDVLACTPDYDSAEIQPVEALMAKGKPIMLWIDAYIPQEWGVCVSWACIRAYEKVKVAKVRRILDYDGQVWGFDIFIGDKPNNTPSRSVDLKGMPALRAYLEGYFSVH